LLDGYLVADQQIGLGLRSDHGEPFLGQHINRKMEMAPLSEVRPLTGYIRGGVTALAAKKDYPVYLDESAYLWDAISVSAGVRGTQILLSPDDYMKATKASVGAISRPKRS